jgi:hypothetical protein
MFLSGHEGFGQKSLNEELVGVPSSKSLIRFSSLGHPSRETNKAYYLFKLTTLLRIEKILCWHELCVTRMRGRRIGVG